MITHKQISYKFGNCHLTAPKGKLSPGFLRVLDLQVYCKLKSDFFSLQLPSKDILTIPVQ